MDSTHRPTEIRRRLRPVTPFHSRIYSLSRKGKEIQHEVSIDTVTGKVSCTCEDFTYHRGRQLATVHTPDLWCKHLLRLAEYLLRKGV